MSETIPKLEDCPFCGAEARLVKTPTDGAAAYAIEIRCSNCRANMRRDWRFIRDDFMEGMVAELAVSWNRRMTKG